MLFLRKMEIKIRLKNIQVFGWHGVADKEKKIGQQFEIDIEASAPLQKAIQTDDIRQTNDYSEMYDKVVKVFSAVKYNLIEALAAQIAKEITNEFNLTECKVVIRKPDAPINGILETVEVEVNYHA